MTRGGTKPKTVSRLIIMEDAEPVARWLRPNLAEPRMMIDKDAIPGLHKFLKHAGMRWRAGEFRIRLDEEQMRSLSRQFAFWECCQDELPERMRSGMPGPDCFASLRLDTQDDFIPRH